MAVDEFLADRKSEAQTLVPVIDGIVFLIETLKDVGLGGLTNSATIVFHSDDSVSGPFRCEPTSYFNPSTSGSELKGVAEKVEENLENAVGVGVNKQWIGVRLVHEADVALGGGSAKHLDSFADDVLQVDAVALDPEFSGIDASGFEEVVDHGAELIDTFEDDVEGLFLVGRDGAGQAIEQDGGELVDTGERRAEFVRNVGE
jgi:hypothetical protein